jgi:hypothetical protein
LFERRYPTVLFDKLNTHVRKLLLAKLEPFVREKPKRLKESLIRIAVALSLSVVFVFMSAFGRYRAYEHTESVAFCGQTCHETMKGYRNIKATE